MPRGPIRTGQLIAPHGPGAIVIDRTGTPLVVAGLDYWFIKEPRHNFDQRWTNDLDEFKFSDWRLLSLLGLDHFRRPPDYRHVLGQDPPPNADLTIPTFRLPRWYVTSRTPPDNQGFRPMVYVDARKRKLEAPAGLGRLLPVRFISICPDGHLDDFPWARWLGCPVGTDGQTPRTGHSLELSDSGGETLSTIRVRCACDKSKVRSLAGITTKTDQPFTTVLTDELNKRDGEHAGCCRGKRPWVDSNNETQCGKPIVGALISGSNVYFARNQTSVYIPQAIEQNNSIPGEIQRALTNSSRIAQIIFLWQTGDKSTAILFARSALQGIYETSQISENNLMNAIESVANGKPIQPVIQISVPTAHEHAEVSYRRVEYNILREPYNDPSEPDLKIREVDTPSLPEIHVPGFPAKNYLGRVKLVEKLRVTRVFLGFDRVKPGDRYGAEAAQDAIKQVFKDPDKQLNPWLPGIEIRGEGIYLELNEKVLEHWIKSQANFLRDRLPDAYLARFNSPRYLAPSNGLAGDSGRAWLARYLLVHGLAHALINQLVFECGYSSAALRERLYISADRSAPMAGLLIYTAAGDSEGTLGGLVRLGRPERFASVILRALKRIAWCSADPVCSEVAAQGPDGTNKAACHACMLLPETSCETINRGLDRAVLVGTPESPDSGFFSRITSEMVINC